MRTDAKEQSYLEAAAKNYEANSELQKLFGSKIPKALKKPGILQQTWARRLALNPDGLNGWLDAFRRVENIEGYRSWISWLGDNLGNADCVRGALGELYAADFLLKKPIPSLNCMVDEIQFAPKSNELVDLSFKVKNATHLASVKTISSIDPLFETLTNRIQYEALWDQRFNRHFSITPSVDYGHSAVGNEKRRAVAERFSDDLIEEMRPLLSKEGASKESIDIVIRDTAATVSWEAKDKFGGAGLGMNTKQSGFVQEKKLAFLLLGPLWPPLLSTVHKEFLKFHAKYDGVTEDKHLIYVQDLDTLPLFFGKELNTLIDGIWDTLGIDTFFNTELLLMT